MCTCIDNIKVSYSEIGRMTARATRQSFCKPVASVLGGQPSVNEYLDAVNVAARELQKVTDSINDLVEIVRNNFCDITPSEADELLMLSAPVSEKMQALHRKILRSSIYAGMETVVGLYNDAMTGFEELCSDLKTWDIDAPDNNHLQQTLELLKTIA